MKKIINDFFVWGFTLWIFGYILGIFFFAFVPQNLLGFVIMPFGIIATFLVLFKKIKSESLKYYFFLGLCWTLLAIICDYLFLVKLFQPKDGYYKLDVFIYYLATFFIPISFGIYKLVTNRLHV